LVAIRSARSGPVDGVDEAPRGAAAGDARRAVGRDAVAERRVAERAADAERRAADDRRRGAVERRAVAPRGERLEFRARAI
jgi:hypothetical protein